jgi:hypothetical protein
VYDGDAAEPASSSMSVELDVQAEPTSVSIFSQVSSTNYGDPLTLTARVTGSNSTGTVTFLSSNGYLVLGSAPVIDGVATLTLADPLDAGSYQFVASYSGDALHAGSASATIMQTVVVAAPPSLTLRSQVGALPVGAILVLTAQLTLNGQGVRSGVVEFFDGNTYLGSAYVQPDGIAQLSVSTLAAGTHAIRAAYRNNSYQTSEALSPVIVEVTNIVGPTLSVTPSGWISIGQGQTTTLRAILSGGASPTGVVTFSANVGFGSLPSDHKVLGTATVVDGVATLEIDASDIGNDYLSVGVSYSGDANNSGTSLNNAVSISPTYTSATETRIASSTSLDYTTRVDVLGSSVTISATIGDTEAQGTVSFYTGDVLLGSAVVVDGKAALTVKPSRNAFDVTAVYSGDGTRAPSKATLGVIAAQPPTTVSIVQPIDRLVTGLSTNLYVRADGPYRTGYVEVFFNGVSRGTTYLYDGFTFVQLAPEWYPAAGNYDVQLKFVADDNMATATSATTHLVAISQSRLDLVASPRNPSVGAQVTLTATVNGSNPTGTVTFYDGDNALGSAQVVNGVATFTTRRSTQGYAFWNAAYSGDARNTVSEHHENEYSTPTTVQPVSSVIDLAIEASGGPGGSQQQVTATITGLKPTGVVTFFDRNGKPLGTAAVSETDLISQGKAVFVLPLGADGLGVASATYSGDVNNATSVSAAVQIPQSAQMAVSSSDPLSVHGMPVELRASIGATNAGGTVVFFGTNGKELGRAAVVAGVAVITVDDLPAGKNYVTAMYLGDGENGFATAKLVQEVAQSRINPAHRRSSPRRSRAPVPAIRAARLRSITAPASSGMPIS